MDIRHHKDRLFALAATAALLTACHSDAAPNTADDCGPEDDIERGADTAGEGIKTGAVAVGEGVDTLGSATAEFFKEGSESAGEKWDAEAADTDAEVREHAAETRRTARSKHCR